MQRFQAAPPGSIGGYGGLWSSCEIWAKRKSGTTDGLWKQMEDTEFLAGGVKLQGS